MSSVYRWSFSQKVKWAVGDLPGTLLAWVIINILAAIYCLVFVNIGYVGTGLAGQVIWEIMRISLLASLPIFLAIWPIHLDRWKWDPYEYILGGGVAGIVLVGIGGIVFLFLQLAGIELPAPAIVASWVGKISILAGIVLFLKDLRVRN